MLSSDRWSHRADGRFPVGQRSLGQGVLGFPIRPHKDYWGPLEVFSVWGKLTCPDLDYFGVDEGCDTVGKSWLGGKP